MKFGSKFTGGREHGPITLFLEGNKERAAMHEPTARLILGELKRSMQLAGITHNRAKKILSDKTVIEVLSIFGQGLMADVDIVKITAQLPELVAPVSGEPEHVLLHAELTWEDPNADFMLVVIDPLNNLSIGVYNTSTEEYSSLETSSFWQETTYRDPFYDPNEAIAASDSYVSFGFSSPATQAREIDVEQYIGIARQWQQTIVPDAGDPTATYKATYKTTYDQFIPLAGEFKLNIKYRLNYISDEPVAWTLKVDLYDVKSIVEFPEEFDMVAHSKFPAADIGFYMGTPDSDLVSAESPTLVSGAAPYKSYEHSGVAVDLLENTDDYDVYNEQVSITTW